MSVLSFKDWYKNKEKSSKSISSESGVTKISENIFRAPSKMLHIEIDPFLEKPTSSKNKIDRFYLSAEIESYSSVDLNFIQNFMSEAIQRGNRIYLVGYDFSSSDPKKCIANSNRLVKGLKKNLNLSEEIGIRGLGSFERINSSHLSIVPKSFSKRRIELIECRFNTDEIGNQIELNFNFNPNDSEILEKYKMGLKNILFQSILLKESFTMKIGVFKNLLTPISENEKNEMDLSLIQEMKYPEPNKSSILFPQNKPKMTRDKITVKELTEKRASSIVKYLSQISEGMKINFIPDGMGYKNGDHKIIIYIE
jgi:hypothetical protein